MQMNLQVWLDSSISDIHFDLVSYDRHFGWVSETKTQCGFEFSFMSSMFSGYTSSTFAFNWIYYAFNCLALFASEGKVSKAAGIHSASKFWQSNMLYQESIRCKVIFRSFTETEDLGTLRLNLNNILILSLLNY